MLIAAAGPWIAVGLSVFLLRAASRKHRRVLVQLAQEEGVLTNRTRTLRGRHRARLESIQSQEEAIHRIAERYEISKEFLGTLEMEPALQIAHETLAREIPSMAEADRVHVVERFRSLVRQGTVSRAALLELLPQHLVQGASRHWEEIAGQMELGLRRVALYAQVQELATHDALTGLLTRRAFQEHIREEIIRCIRRQVPIAFLMVDLDHFKKVNDTYGHLVGDVVLRETAGILHRSVREVDLVGRFGGEEFAIALPETDPEVALGVARRIQALMETTVIQAYDEQVSITVSIGVAMAPQDARSAEQLIERADRALYQAKAAGRNRVVVSEGGGPK